MEERHAIHVSQSLLMRFAHKFEKQLNAHVRLKGFTSTVNSICTELPGRFVESLSLSLSLQEGITDTHIAWVYISHSQRFVGELDRNDFEDDDDSLDETPRLRARTNGGTSPFRLRFGRPRSESEATRLAASAQTHLRVPDSPQRKRSPSPSSASLSFLPPKRRWWQFRREKRAEYFSLLGPLQYFCCFDRDALPLQGVAGLDKLVDVVHRAGKTMSSCSVVSDTMQALDLRLTRPSPSLSSDGNTPHTSNSTHHNDLPAVNSTAHTSASRASTSNAAPHRPSMFPLASVPSFNSSSERQHLIADPNSSQTGLTPRPPNTDRPLIDSSLSQPRKPSSLDRHRRHSNTNTTTTINNANNNNNTTTTSISNDGGRINSSSSNSSLTSTSNLRVMVFREGSFVAAVCLVEGHDRGGSPGSGGGVETSRRRGLTFSQARERMRTDLDRLKVLFDFLSDRNLRLGDPFNP
mmetsp:Transcript_26546/g.44359  ORF Transcript_26546/g.44359 Transcript_26546/m.44359 type:complete len:465 (-) Transcript_26546:737-2131(-)